MEKCIKISERWIGTSKKVYIVAEMSANHNQDFDKAVEIIHAAKKSGADAIKLQTYTPDTITIKCDNDYFKIKNTIWEGKTLYDLYKKAYTPWEWHQELKKLAENLGLDFFSTPFDHTAVDFLESLKVPAYKVASFELVDLPLLRKIAATGKPIIISTGMASLSEIDEAVKTIQGSGCDQFVLLKCTSAYPSPPDEINLRTIPNLSKRFGSPVGLSDHTQGIAVPVAAVAMGASVIEKHLTLSRRDASPDRDFSLEPDEFKIMVDAVRIAERAMGDVHYGVTDHEFETRIFRRSLFVVEDMKAGDTFTKHNIRSIRPGHGLHPRYYDDILGKNAKIDIDRGTPLNWNMI